MTALTGKQRRYLKGAAHDLSPTVHVGRPGLTDAVRAQTEAALSAHELVKVRLAAERPERDEQALKLATEVNAALVGTIGRIAILYRAHEEPESRRFRLPAG